MWYLLLLPALLFADVDPSSVSVTAESPATEASSVSAPAPVAAATSPEVTATPAAPTKNEAASVAVAPAPEVKAEAPATTAINVPAPTAQAAGAPATPAEPAIAISAKAETPAALASASAAAPAEAPATAKADETPAAPVAPAPVVEAVPASASVPAIPTASTTVAPVPAATIPLHLKPAASSAIVLTLPEAEVNAASQDAHATADGQKWFSVERPVTLTGYVDKASIGKDLDVAKGAVVWTTPEKTEQLTVVDNPEAARLLEVDRMGKVEVKEPRVLYYGVPTTEEASAAAPKVTAAPAIDEKSQAQTSNRRGEAIESAPGNFRTIEGELRKGNPLLGGKLYLVDAHGNFVAKIDTRSSLDRMTIERYVGQTAVYTGELHDAGGELVLAVRSIRLQ